MREYYKNGASNPDELFVDFHFDEIEVDASSYGFIRNNDNNEDEKTNDLDSNKSPDLVAKSVINDAKLDSQEMSKSTDIITIELFTQDDVLMNPNSKSLIKSKPRFMLVDKISTLLSTLTK